MTEILLIRHGETDWNVEKRLQGHTDIDLNREGVRQAAALGRALLNEPLDAIGTAQGIAIPRGMNIQLDTGLRERCFGAFEGLNHPEISERFPDDYAAWKRRDIDARYPQGEFHAETLREFSNRAVDAITSLASAYRKVAIVTHGGVLDSVYPRAKNRGSEHPRDFDVLNASINRVTWDGTNFQILKWADVAHLSHAALDESDNLA